MATAQQRLQHSEIAGAWTTCCGSTRNYLWIYMRKFRITCIHIQHNQRRESPHQLSSQWLLLSVVVFGSEVQPLIVDRVKVCVGALDQLGCLPRHLVQQRAGLLREEPLAWTQNVIRNTHIQCKLYTEYRCMDYNCCTWQLLYSAYLTLQSPHSDRPQC